MYRKVNYGKTMTLSTIFSMMTEREFWDMFHKKHNPRYYKAKKKPKKKKTENKKTGRSKSTKRYSIFKI